MAAFPEMLELRVECGARRSGCVVLVLQLKSGSSLPRLKNATVCREAHRHRPKFFWRFGVMHDRRQ